MIKLFAEHLIQPEHEANFQYHNRLKYWTIVHCHDFYEVFLILEGTVIHIVNETRQILRKGDMVFIRPQDIHSYEKYDYEEVVLLNINFRSETIAAALSYLGEGFQTGRFHEVDSLPPYTRLSPDEMSHIWVKYEQITSIPLEFAAKARTATRSLLMLLLSEHFVPTALLGVKPETPNWLQELQIKMLKREHFAEGLAAIYRFSNVSQEHLCRCFVKFLGRTPTNWVNELRIHHAAHMLVHSNIEIVAIALDCGFNSLSHFYTVFQHTYHMSPGKFRSTYRRAAIPQ